MTQGVFTPEVPVEDDLWLGEGIYYADYGEVGEAVIGATRGGSKVEIDKVIKEIAYDGAYGPTKDMRRYERYVPRFMVNLLKMTYDSLTYAMAADSSDEGDYHEITFRLNIEDTDYLTNITFVGKTHAGDNVIITIYNPLNDGNVTLDFKEKDELVSELQYTGHYDPTTPTTPPIEVHEYYS